MKTTTKNIRAYTIQGASEYAGVSRGTVENWLNNRLLPFEKLPGRGKGNYRFIRIRAIHLNKFLDEHLVIPHEQSCQTVRNEIILTPKRSENLNDAC